MKRKNTLLKHFDFLALDILTLIVSLFVSSYLRFKSLTIFSNSAYLSMMFVCLLSTILVSYSYQPFKNVLKKGYLNDINKSLIKNILCFSFVCFYLFVSKSSEEISRIYLCLALVIHTILTSIVRILRRKAIVAGKVNNANSKKSILIICDPKHIKDISNNIKKDLTRNTNVYNYCILDKSESCTNEINVVCDYDDLYSYVCHNWIDEILIALDYNDIPNDLMENLGKTGIVTNVVLPKFSSFEGQQQSITKSLGYYTISSSIRPKEDWEIILKRLMDIVGGLVGSLFTIILTIIIGPIIYIKSPGPIFYKQERIGLNGRRFKMIKFRSMVTNADDLKKDLEKQNRIKDGMMFKIENDPRIIPGIGNFIRKTSIDEFPQFFNVLKGDMSLVGTRPPTVDEWEKYGLEHRIRMIIKPGITGLWQISGRSEIIDFDEVINLDTKYIKEFSIGNDIRILIKTVLVLLSKSSGAM